MVWYGMVWYDAVLTWLSLGCNAVVLVFDVVGWWAEKGVVG
jgi:hypothetical protein